MQKVALMLVSLLLVFSLVSCKSKKSEDETTVNTSEYTQTEAGDVSVTDKKDSLVGEVTSVIDDITSVAHDIANDFTADESATAR